MKTKTEPKSASKKYRITSWIYIAIVLVILVLVNVLVNVFSVRFDFSGSNRYSLSGEGRDALDKVATKEVEIIACQDRIAYNGNIYMSSVAEIIEEIGEYKDNVTVSFQSIDKNPDIAQPYSVGLELTSVLVRLKDDVQKYRILDVSTMFEASSTNSSMIGESKAEYLLVSAIDYVCRDEYPNIYITTNHQESSPTEFLNLLIGNNYRVYEHNLVARELPEDADYVMIFQPRQDFSDLEIERLEAFLLNGGQYGKNVFIFMSPVQDELPNLQGFMEEWGISVDDGYLYNTNYSIDQENLAMLVDFSDVNSAGIYYKNLTLVSYITRPLSAVYSQRDDITVTPMLMTLNYTQYVEDVQNEADPSNDPEQTSAVMMYAHRQPVDADQGSNLVVSGSYNIISDEFISSTYGNKEYMLQITDYMNPNRSNIIIFPKNMETPLLPFSSTTNKTVFFLIFSIAIPLAVAACGLAVYMKRRHM